MSSDYYIFAIYRHIIIITSFFLLHNRKLLLLANMFLYKNNTFLSNLINLIKFRFLGFSKCCYLRAP
jgi:hypothetical protein